MGNLTSCLQGSHCMGAQAWQADLHWLGDSCSGCFRSWDCTLCLRALLLCSTLHVLRLILWVGKRCCFRWNRAMN